MDPKRPTARFAMKADQAVIPELAGILTMLDRMFRSLRARRGEPAHSRQRDAAAEADSIGVAEVLCPDVGC